MRKLIRVSRGLGVTEKNDISQYIPDYTETREYSLRLWSNLMKLRDGTSSCACGCSHDGYFAGTTQAPVPGNPLEQLHSYSSSGIDINQNFGGYANAMHQAPGHKCYPFTGGSVLTGSVTDMGDVFIENAADSFVAPLQYPRDVMMQDNLIGAFNHIVLHYIAHALMVKKCHTDKPVRELNMEDMFYSVLEKVTSYVTTCNSEEIIGISCVDTQFGDSPSTLYQNAILIHLSSANLSPNFRTLAQDLDELGVVVRFGRQEEVDKVLQHKNTILNWSFGISSTSATTLDLIFAGCRTDEADQHKVTVVTTHNIGASVPVNVAMLVDNDASLEFVATMPTQYMLGGLVIDIPGEAPQTVPVTLDTVDLLRGKYGISLQQLEGSQFVNCGCGRSYQFKLTNVKTDMRISLFESLVVDDMNYLSLVEDKSFVMFKNTDGVNVEPNTIVPALVRCQFARRVAIADIHKIAVYAIPVDMYSVPEVSSMYRVPRSVNMIPMGFGEEPAYQISTTVNSNLFNKTGTVLLRIVVGEGALLINTDGGQVRNTKYCMQFECKLGESRPLTTWIGTLDPDDFTPVTPSTMSFAKLSTEQQQYFMLLNEDANEYSLVVNGAAKVPSGLTNMAQYNAREILGLADGEKYYFAQVLLPVASLYDNSSLDIGDFFKAIDVSVTSHVNGVFYMMYENCETRKLLSNDPDVREKYCVRYYNLQRPWVDGYIEIPLVFAEKDSIEITVPAINKTFIIYVYLDIQEDDPDEDDPVTDPENPGGEDKGDEGTTDPVEPPKEEEKDPGETEGGEKEPSTNPDNGGTTEGGNTGESGDIKDPTTDPDNGETTEGDGGGDEFGENTDGSSTVVGEMQNPLWSRG